MFQIEIGHQLYPDRLLDVHAPPRTLHVNGSIDRWSELIQTGAVAIVGTRHATRAGVEVARMLGRGLSAAGITVVSGMAGGIDSAAHAGALEAGGNTVAVLPAAPQRSTPAANRQLHKEIVQSAAVVSEFGPEVSVQSWLFPVRNRLIAGMAGMTIVVEASGDSGALITATNAAAYGRVVGAVPGSVLNRQSDGPNELLASGAAVVVRHVQDALDALYGVGVRSVPQPQMQRRALEPDERAVYQAIQAGADSVAALVATGMRPATVLPLISALEISGWIQREPGGAFTARA